MAIRAITPIIIWCGFRRYQEQMEWGNGLAGTAIPRLPPVPATNQSGSRRWPHR